MDGSPEEKDPLQGASSQNKGQAQSAVEKEIRDEEVKKTALNQLLGSYLGDHIGRADIFTSRNDGCVEMWRRLVRAPPVEPEELETREKVLVVEDRWERYPSFEELLYCDLDRSLVLIYIMLFAVFEEAVPANGLLSLLCAYVVERILRWRRAEKGVDRLRARAYVGERFLG